MATITAPERSTRQRIDALARANEVRGERAKLKRDLKAGRARVVAVIEDPPEFCETMKVYDLLLATPKLGRVKVNRVLRVCGCSPHKTLGGLSSRQRLAVVRELEGAGR